MRTADSPIVAKRAPLVSLLLFRATRTRNLCSTGLSVGQVLDLRRPCAVLLQLTYRLVNSAASITIVNARAAATAAKLKWEPLLPDTSQAINRLAVPLQHRQSRIPSARRLRAAKAMTRAHQAIRILS
jgi:hypothetical protein